MITPISKRLHLTHPGMVMLFMCVLYEMGMSKTYAEVEVVLKGIERAAREKDTERELWQQH